MPKQKQPPPPSKNVTVHYRRLDRAQEAFPNNITLAESLRRALQNVIEGNAVENDVRLRIQDSIPEKPGDVRCWNNIRANHQGVFGTLCLYRPYELQAVIASRGVTAAIDAFPLDQICGNIPHDFVRAIAYWMAVEDHFYLIQSVSIQTDTMDSYFTWLLKKTGIIGENQRVFLMMDIDPDSVGGDLENLQVINYSGIFKPPTVEKEPSDEDGVDHSPGGIDLRLDGHGKAQTRRIGRLPEIDGWSIFPALGETRMISAIQEAFTRLRREDPNATLKASVEFAVRSFHKGEEAKKAKQKTLHAIRTNFRDMPEGSVTARGQEGVVRDTDIRLQSIQRVALAPLPGGASAGAKSTFLDYDDVFRKLKIVHDRFCKDGRIKK